MKKEVLQALVYKQKIALILISIMMSQQWIFIIFNAQNKAKKSIKLFLEILASNTLNQNKNKSQFKNINQIKNRY